MKKVWSNPSVEEISVKETACGGPTATNHDACIYEVRVNGVPVAVEEYFPASGTTNVCANPEKHN